MSYCEEWTDYDNRQPKEKTLKSKTKETNEVRETSKLKKGFGHNKIVKHDQHTFVPGIVC